MIIPTILGLVLLFSTLPFKDSHYTFNWDQANDYEAVAKIASGKLTLIGPRVTSDTGFFLAPWHYYFLLPFYLLTNSSLFMGFWAALFVQYLFILASYFLSKKWFGPLAGLSVGILASTPASVTEWGFMYVPLLSLLFFYTCQKTLQKPHLLPLLSFLLGFGCTTYSVFYALIIPTFYIVIKLYLQKSINLKTIFFSKLCFMLPYLPLLIFDIRHDFLNLKNFVGFAGGQHGSGATPFYFLQVFLRALEVFWFDQKLVNPFSLIITIFTILVLGVGTTILFKKHKVLVLIWVFSSLLPLSLFKGTVSEYYYAPVTLLIPFFLAGILVKRSFLSKLMLIFMVFAIVSLRIKNNLQNTLAISLNDKITLVGKMDIVAPKYSMSYDLPLGEDSGYREVFKKTGKNYVDNGTAQLYTISQKENPTTSGTMVFSLKNLVIIKR